LGGLTTPETRRADMVEIYKSLRGFEETDDVEPNQKRVGRTRGHDWKLLKKTS